MSNSFCKIKSTNSKLLKKKRKTENCISLLNNRQSVRVTIQLDPSRCNKQKNIQFIVEKETPLKQIKDIANAKIGQLKLKNKVIGFECVNSDYGIDYQLQKGVGFISNKELNLKCFIHQNISGLEKYKICTCLAIGGFSKVFLVRSKASGEFFAAKFMKKQNFLTNDRKTLLQNQKNISSSVQHPFLVKTVEYIQTTTFNIFIMQYCPGGQLFFKLKQANNLNEHEARFCFIQILLGIQELHRQNIMYRDLKPQNILLDHQGHLKIADFGLAKPSTTKSYSFCGSLEYMPPQIIQGTGHSKQVDYYCIGALLYQILLGRPPFYDPNSNQKETKMKILSNNPRFPSDNKISNEAKDLIIKLLNKNEKYRLGYLGGVKQIMAHPWVGKITRQNYLQKRIKSPFYVDLSKLNFDSSQVGYSERNFQKKIQRQIKSQSKKKMKHRNLRESRKMSETGIKKQRSPYQIRTNSFNIAKNKERKQVKSPYQKVLQPKKNVHILKKSYRILKTETFEDRTNFSHLKKNKLESFMRFTEQDQNKENNRFNNTGFRIK